MTEKQYEQLSSLVDGEIENSADEIIDRITDDIDLTDKWWRYHLISDALRREKTILADKGLSQRVASAIADEPIVFSPAAQGVKKKESSWQRSVAGFAIAASVAAGAILTVQKGENITEPSAQKPSLAQVSPYPSPPSQVASIPAQVVNAESGNTIIESTPVNSSRLNSYMLNYSEFRTSGSTMQGMLPYVRVIANDVEEKAE
jgi:sigma-E factor negative regulatory protein RseA